MTVKADEYLQKLVEYCIMKIYAIATVEETRQTWAEEDDFQVLKPNIDIKVSSERFSEAKYLLIYCCFCRFPA